jgi:3-phenylpropionate/trans-cinnamate dioxygenase ferredoxin reductase subunit
MTAQIVGEPATPVHAGREIGSVVIVGAGVAGANAASLLRQSGFTGPVVLIGEEPHLPYHRPVLSKTYLKGDVADHELLIKPTPFYPEQHIDLRLGCRVVAVDADANVVLLDSGETVAYGRLILATGAHARRVDIPGADLDGVHSLRSLADADLLAGKLGNGVRLVIVGGGYIGLEVAASARQLGCEVTVLERESRALARVSSSDLAQFLVALHARTGCTVETEVEVRGLTDRGDGTVSGVVLADGRTILADVVLVGVGAVPSDDVAARMGLRMDGGIVVDEHARTSRAGTYAIGDATQRPMHHYDGQFRLESIPSAVEQARQAVADILGLPGPKPEVPWFWSDQYDAKVKIAGLVSQGSTTVARPCTSPGRLAVFHLDARGRTVAVETVNAPQEFMLGRRLIESGLVVDPTRLADVTIPLKELLPPVLRPTN